MPKLSKLLQVSKRPLTLRLGDRIQRKAETLRDWRIRTVTGRCILSISLGCLELRDGQRERSIKAMNRLPIVVEGHWALVGYQGWGSCCEHLYVF